LLFKYWEYQSLLVKSRHLILQTWALNKTFSFHRILSRWMKYNSLPNYNLGNMINTELILLFHSVEHILTVLDYATYSDVGTIRRWYQTMTQRCVSNLDQLFQWNHLNHIANNNNNKSFCYRNDTKVKRNIILRYFELFCFGPFCRS
jgi:hypothetical protein